jgi:hypothetical protein
VPIIGNHIKHKTEDSSLCNGLNVFEHNLHKSRKLSRTDEESCPCVHTLDRQRGRRHSPHLKKPPAYARMKHRSPAQSVVHTAERLCSSYLWTASFHRMALGHIEFSCPLSGFLRCHWSRKMSFSFKSGQIRVRAGPELAA